jgi:hypothetical protein
MDPLTWRRTDRTARVRFLARQPANARKLRLFAAACCRRVWARLPDGRSRAAVEVAERLADGLVGEAEIRAAAEAASSAQYDVQPAGLATAAAWAALHAARAAYYCLTYLPDTAAEDAVHAAACTVPRAPRGSSAWAMAYKAA